MYSGLGRRDIRARSSTFVVWVAEKSIDWRFSIISDNIGGNTIGKDANNLLHVFLKPNFQNTICLVDNQSLEIPKDKSFGIL